jgi:hypothetical protein
LRSEITEINIEVSLIGIFEQKNRKKNLSLDRISKVITEEMLVASEDYIRIISCLQED